MELGRRVDLDRFLAALSGAPVTVADSVRARLQRDRAVVDAKALGAQPVYGLNTGLGANLAHRIAPEEIGAFQQQIIDGRAVSTGDPLPEGTGRGVLLARLVSVAADTAGGGGSGMSLAVFEHLLACVVAQVDPPIPEFGSIGASDLTQNAVWAKGILSAVPGVVPVLQAKDAMALINHGGVTLALAAQGLAAARFANSAQRAAILLSYAGYDANQEGLSEAVNGLRVSPGQAEVAAWLRGALQGGSHAPRRVQEALSFRTVAPALGAAEDALQRAIAIWEDELNGLQDSPVVLDGAEMCSTPNFVAPALTLALEGVCLAQAMLAGMSVQRMQRLMDPALSGLPRYLAPGEGAAAGLVPLQKTAAAVAGEIRALSVPVRFDTAPVSASVEDFAAETQPVARRLTRQAALLEHLGALEALVAAQALDLRAPARMSPLVAALHGAIRVAEPVRMQDQPLGDAGRLVAQALRAVTL